MADDADASPDPAIIEAHLEALFGSPGDLHDGLIEIAHGKDGPATAKLFTIDELYDAADYATKVNLAGDQVYVGAALRKPGYQGHKSKLGGRWTLRAEREHVYGSCLLWADADTRAELDHAVQQYRAKDCPPDLIVITGSVPEYRAQLWWRLDNPITDLDRLEAALAGIAGTLGTDAVIDAPRVMRLAGTVNWPRKPGRLPERVTMRWRNGPDSHTPFFAAWNAYHLNGAAQPTTTKEPVDSIRTLTGQLDLMAALAAAASSGQWHTTLLRVVAHLAGIGRTDDEILLLCRAFTQPGYTDQQTDDAIGTMLSGARAKGWTPSVVTHIEAGDAPQKRERPHDIPDLPENLIPTPFRDYVLERCEAMQVPLEYVAVPMLVAAGNLMAGRLAIRPRKSNWLVTSNLWGAIVGPPGALKSPSIHAALKPLRAVEHTAWQQHRQDMLAWEEAGKQGQPPRARRFATNDATEAKLGDMLADNPNGILLVRDELTGWLNHMASPQRSAERQFFLEGWNGLSPYVQDRIGRGTVRVDRLCVGVFGGLQPDVFERDFLENAEQSGNDGLIQRFQLLVWPELAREWHDIDRWPDPQHDERATATFTRLAEIEPATIGRQNDRDPCVWITFSSGAQEVFNHFLATVERKLRSGTLPRFVDAHLSKYRSLMPALALTIHMAENPSRIGPTEVSERAARMALDWCEYLRKVAHRVYAMPEHRQSEAVAAVAEAIHNGRVVAVANRPDRSFTARDVVSLRLAKIGRNMASVQDSLDALVEDGLLSVREIRGRGRGGSFRLYQTT